MFVFLIGHIYWPVEDSKVNMDFNIEIWNANFIFIVYRIISLKVSIFREVREKLSLCLSPELSEFHWFLFTNLNISLNLNLDFCLIFGICWTRSWKINISINWKFKNFFSSRRNLRLEKFQQTAEDEVRQTKNSLVTNSVRAKATRPFITGQGNI